MYSRYAQDKTRTWKPRKICHTISHCDSYFMGFNSLIACVTRQLHSKTLFDIVQSNKMRFFLGLCASMNKRQQLGVGRRPNFQKISHIAFCSPQLTFPHWCQIIIIRQQFITNLNDGNYLQVLSVVLLWLAWTDFYKLSFPGSGRCGNGTLTLNSVGTDTQVQGMTYIDEKLMWVFSITSVSNNFAILSQSYPAMHVPNSFFMFPSVNWKICEFVHSFSLY